jgi:hypothetical protein
MGVERPNVIPQGDLQSDQPERKKRGRPRGKAIRPLSPVQIAHLSRIHESNRGSERSADTKAKLKRSALKRWEDLREQRSGARAIREQEEKRVEAHQTAEIIFSAGKTPQTGPVAAQVQAENEALNQLMGGVVEKLGKMEIVAKRWGNPSNNPLKK